MPELLLELLSEEIPARMQSRAAEEFKRLVTEGLEKQRLIFERADAYATPRRLALVVDGLPERQPETREEKRGPKVGAPDNALSGFVRSLGGEEQNLSFMRGLKIDGEPFTLIQSSDAVSERNVLVSAKSTATGTYFMTEIVSEDRYTHDILSPIVVDAIGRLAWPKAMRWSNTIFTWIRPLKSILAIFDGRSLNQDYGLGIRKASKPGKEIEESIFIKFDNSTAGHRFLAPKRFEVSSFNDYEAKLREAKVVLNSGERRALVEKELKRLAKIEKLSVKEDTALLEEVAGLVEWPIVLLGGIDERYMGLPDEVLATVMRRHQKYFSLEREDGTLAPNFAVVANIEATDGGAKIIAGNERVLAARLADAQFFWDQDLKRRLEGREHLLQGIMFHSRLGTLAHKVVQTERLAGEICNTIKPANQETVRRAAKLAKLDLLTEMVKEFPELQGVIGRYYALAQDELEVVADAIAMHYKPQGPRDSCPTEPNAVCVALADKIDTLAGFWVIDEKPTGSRDPFALRRAAIGVIRLILENEIHINLRSILGIAVLPYMIHRLNNESDFANSFDPKLSSEEENFAKKLDENYETKRSDERLNLASNSVIESLLDFFRDRLTVFLKDSGFRYDLVNALLGNGNEDDLLQLVQKAEALRTFFETDDGSNLLTAYRRASNIVRIEEGKDGKSYIGDPDDDQFTQPEELVLWAKLNEAEQQNSTRVDMEHFNDLLLAIAGLREPIDQFFDKITVNTNDPVVRENRLRLLSEINMCLNRVADFSQIEG